MKVRELVAELQKLDPELPVWLRVGWPQHPVASVGVVPPEPGYEDVMPQRALLSNEER